ncbi:oligoendopeptidase F [Heliobacterium undosum]|uniref:Oligopeptidase F n=1 Tax=Heliomicrobium undosum TaxID=121734 RepID=A0A845L6E9_9FIRM|nr:oligoendopeptidase F [Heliomicrobium undosum]MZP31276.1 oligoendopeptidase F [Heliomicrobium undosum]
MEKEKALPKRQDISAEFKWKLEDIYPADDAWEKDFQAVPSLLEKMTALKGKLQEKSANLLTVLQLQDELGKMLEKIFTYARMRRDEDNANPAYQALTDRAVALNARAAGATSFLTPEILAIPDDTLQRFQKEEQGLALYRFLLDDLKRQKAHVLTADEEAILAQASELGQSPGQIFTMLNNADLTFPTIRDEEGREVEITHGRYGQLMESKDRRVRREAFHGMYGTYKKLENTLATTFSSAIKRDVFFSRVRRYPSALEAALFGDNVPKDVYDNLIGTVRKHNDAMHRYVRLRKKLLGVDQLHMYDLYVPMVADVDWKVTYNEALEMVKQGLEPLGADYGRVLDESFQTGWIDVYENKGKTSGAYSWGPYGTHPYVLLNYQDRLDDVFTLAHEMGHALHSYYSHKEQPYIYSSYTIFVAEVASTVNETLLIRHMLEKEQDKGRRLFLLNHYLEQFRGTVYRQTMFAEFEKLVHAKIEAAEALTLQELKQIYHRLNVDYYGPDIIVDDDIDIEWARIPHFYNNFYVYKYATGFSAATALSAQILAEGQPAVDRYLTFLKSGGSDYPLELLKRAGVDMGTAEPIEKALSVFRELLDEMEKLATGSN